LFLDAGDDDLEEALPTGALRVTSLEPTASASISAQVNTMVPLSFRKPCCQKISASALRRMTGLWLTCT
jgi:hypothetical protein